MTIFAPSKPNKRSWEETAKIDAELNWLKTANRLCGRYRPTQPRKQDEPEASAKVELDPELNAVVIEEDSAGWQPLVRRS